MDVRSTVGVAGVSSRRARTRDYILAGWASMAGTTIEWYDFFLYGTAAALIFNKGFFLALDSIFGTLAAFVTYGGRLIGQPMGASCSATSATV